MTNFVEVKTVFDTAWVRLDEITSVQFSSNGDCYVACGHTTVVCSPDEGHKLLELLKGEVQSTAAKPEPQNKQVLDIVLVECRETFSKSTNQYFKFWTCESNSGKKVNVFDHPDESRNTFNILKAGDWGHWAEMTVGEIKELDTPLPMLVSFDGEWYSLVAVTPRYAYIALCEYYDGLADDDDMGEDDIPWDSEPDSYDFPENDDERESPLSLELYGDDELEGDE